MLTDHLPFLLEAFPALFWLSHLSILCLGEPRHVRSLRRKVSRVWQQLIYPMRTCCHDAQDADESILCVPYCLTQAVQDAFIRILCEYTSVMERSFRMRLCALPVGLFSGI
jgi:hypothetical protein